MTTQTTTISNQHITEHETVGSMFIREINHPESGHTFMVLDTNSGEYAGNISDGSDCTFDNIESARSWMNSRA